MKKNVFALALCAVLSLSLLSACGGKKSATIKVGASPTPHAQILEVAKDILAKDNITLEIVSYDDYVLPNTNVEDGQLDANYFQHITYMAHEQGGFGVCSHQFHGLLISCLPRLSGFEDIF